MKNSPLTLIQQNKLLDMTLVLGRFNRVCLATLMVIGINLSVNAETLVSPSQESEKHLPFDDEIQQWTKEEQIKKINDAIAEEKEINSIEDEEEQKVVEQKKTEVEKVLKQTAKTVKLENVVPAIQFKSGQADIPDDYIELLRNILDGMKHRVNVRLHFIGHTDDEKLSGKLKEQYVDNTGFSRERTGPPADYIQMTLTLPTEEIYYYCLGYL